MRKLLIFYNIDLIVWNWKNKSEIFIIFIEGSGGFRGKGNWKFEEMGE